MCVCEEVSKVCVSVRRFQRCVCEEVSKVCV